MYVPTTSGKFHRVQVSASGTTERDGFFYRNNQVGFAYFQNEDDCKTFVASAVNGEVPGKVVYVDQLVPISEEAPEYGKQYPYPFRFNGVELTPQQRVDIQVAAASAGLSLMQSGKAIYRKKMYTTDTNRPSIILSADNQDEVNNFISKFLANNGDAKATRLKELKAMTKAARIAAGVQDEYLELAD